MKNKRGFSPIIIVVAVVAVLILVVAFLAFGKNTNLKETIQQIPQRQETENPIRNSSDLDAAEADLDSTDLDEIDSELDQIDTDASTF